MGIQSKRSMTTKTMVLGALMTAMVVVVQLISTYTAFFGPFSTAMALIPIVIGAALCGMWVGAWLGLVFGFVVLVTGGAALFWAFNPLGTIITVLIKGIACGYAAGLVYKLIEKFNRTVAVFVSAVVCPVVNTSVFLLCCLIFFLPYANELATNLNLGVSGMAVFVALAGANFLFEVGINILLSPVILRLLQITKLKKR